MLNVNRPFGSAARPAGYVNRDYALSKPMATHETHSLPHPRGESRVFVHLLAPPLLSARACVRPSVHRVQVNPDHTHTRARLHATERKSNSAIILVVIYDRPRRRPLKISARLPETRQSLNVALGDPPAAPLDVRALAPGEQFREMPREW